MKKQKLLFKALLLILVIIFSSTSAYAATTIGTNISTDGNLVVSLNSTLGTVISGLWNGTAIGSTYGGTGLTSYLTGDTIYASAANTLSKLSAGSDGQVLTLAAGVPSWATPSSGFTDPMTTRGDIIYRDATNTTTRLGAGTAGQVLTSDGTDISWGTSPSAPVTSVFGRTGAVTAASNDYTWAQIDKTTSSLADITTRNISDTTGTLAETRGGTNQTTYATGDTLYASAANTLSKLSAGSDGQVLTLAAGVPSWATPAGGVSGGGTLNYIPKWTPDGSTLGNSLIFDDGTNVGIGTTSPNAKLDVRGDISLGTTAVPQGIFMNTANGADNSWLGLTGGGAYNDPTRGAYLDLFGNEISFLGLGGNVLLSAGQNTSGSGAIYLATDPGTGSVGRLTILNNGNVGISVAVPTALLHLAAGTATASTAPLKFTSGTNLTTPEAGAVEFDGTNFFGTTSSTRYTFAKTLTSTATLDFASTAAQASRDLTIAVTNSVLGDTVVLGVPNASVNANSNYTAWVSAAGTVTVRFNNYSAAAIDPASGTFRVSVLRY